jgi:radical SAM superfamily enzyme YgiQ (UPF0313 family)
MRVYLIAPSPDFGNRVLNDDCSWGVAKSFAITAAAGIATVAAFFPDDTDLRLGDELIEPVDYDDEADIIGISMNVAQAPRGLAIARHFRERGKTVVLGGAHVSLAPQLFEGHGDCLVVGEFEPVAAEFMSDLRAGCLKPRYQGGKADLAASPTPRWDLYPNERALAGVVQTSRGCPFECNFCDVIQYLGRVQRHKPTEQVIREIQTLYDLGYRQINLSDDNFTVYRQRAHALLSAIVDWNGAEGREPVAFLTQMSIDVARQPELLALCNAAGLRFAFVGLETNSIDGLKESRKRQNLRVDLAAECEKIVRAGISLQAGLIVGFDSDDLSCFERQLDFAMSLPIVIFRVSVLVASLATPLYDQMKARGRIVDDPELSLSASAGSMTNIQPMNMTREQLAEGAEWLRHAMLAPENVMVRFERFASVLGEIPEHLADNGRRRPPRRSTPIIELIRNMARDPGARRVIDCVNDLSRSRPRIQADLMQMLGLYLNSYARQPERGRTFGPPLALAQSG